MRSILFVIIFLVSHIGFAADLPIKIFPLDHYDQEVNTWLNPSSLDYDKPLVSVQYQQQRTQDFYNHTFGKLSPWNKNFINQLLEKPVSVYEAEQQIIALYSNVQKTSDEVGYGENFRPHSAQWISAISENINASQFKKALYFNAKHRAIVINNSEVRALPTIDVHFYNVTLPGQGYPFDNLQYSALWVGTPVYIIGVSKDRAWTLVATSSFIGWVKSVDIAEVDNAFFKKWSRVAKKRMGSIIKMQTAIVDQSHHYQFTADIGSIFPIYWSDQNRIGIFIPRLSTQTNKATIKKVFLSKTEIVQIPISATPHHFADRIKALIGRPYGWGNLYFYNDCSAEMKSLFSAFGIWLPRNTAQQISAGVVDDQTALGTDERIAYLMNHGHKLMTLVYIGGHIMLYVGNYPIADQPSPGKWLYFGSFAWKNLYKCLCVHRHCVSFTDFLHQNSSKYDPLQLGCLEGHERQDKPKLMAMTYQNIWGLSPADRSSRSLIGQSVFFPLLNQYPEDPGLASLAAKSYFKLVFLDLYPSYD